MDVVMGNSDVFIRWPIYIILKNSSPRRNCRNTRALRPPLATYYSRVGCMENVM